MWSDNETISDLIDFNHLIDAISAIIDNNSLLPCSVGIFGDWGSGKSSLMRMLEKQYAKQDGTLVIRFNGWLFEGYEDAKTVLMGRIVDEIIKNRKLSQKAKNAAIKILKRIDYIKVGSSLLKYGIGAAALGPVGIAALGATDILGSLKDVDYNEYINNIQTDKQDLNDSVRNNIQEFHKNFDELIAETNIQKLIVFIDDLDRCSPDTVIGTLEAIKLFLFTEKTAFVIGADERLIRYAVKRRFPDIYGESSEVGRDYLEKLIQYPIRIPPLNITELTNYVNLLFSQLYVDPGEFELARENIIKDKSKNIDFIFDVDSAQKYLNIISEEHNEAFLLCSQIVPVLNSGLNGNPRQCKRFLNALLIRYKMAEARGIKLNKRILAKLMLLEYFKPETFKDFHKEQSLNKGILPNIENLENSTENYQNTSNVDQNGYLEDDWIRNWLASSPSLQNENLQPYYYFSRDRLTVLEAGLQRMSPAAQEYYSKLLSDSDAVIKTTLSKSNELSTGDASAIFTALSQKVREEGKNTGKTSPLKKLIDFCRHRFELISQLIVFLDNYPITELPMSTATQVCSLTKNTQYKTSAYKLLEKWSNSTQNKNLAKSSSKQLSKLS